MKPFISIISPVYRAEKTVQPLIEQIRQYIQEITEDFEIILVDDGSPDNSWEVIKKECLSDKRVKGLKFSRNFGQHYAITAGLDQAVGEWVVVMDCDLQDLPSEILQLYYEAIKGYDIVLARRKNRQDSFSKRAFSVFFYKILGYLTGVKQDAAVANFGIYHRKVIDVICSMREQIRYFPTMVRWVGFKKSLVDVKHGARENGRSNYNFRRLLSLAFEILLSNSEKPIRIMVKTGFLISFFTIIISLFFFVKYLKGDIEVAGYTSLILSVWLLGGLMIMLLGIIGLYIGKIFQHVKNRPIYIVAEQKNFDGN